MITTELKNKRINLSGIDLSNLSDEMHDLIYTACKQNYNLSISLENYKIKGEFYNYVLVLVQADTTYGTNGYYLDLGSYYFTIYEDGYRLDKQITLMNVSDDIQAVNLSINNINKELDTLDTGLEALGETVNKNYDSLDSRITSNENKIGVAESDISNIINTELPKVATDIAYNDGFVLQDKNGNDLTFKTPIKLGDNLTYDSETNKINATSSGGGGKLYLHHITLKNDNDNPNYTIVNNLGSLKDLYLSFDVINNSTSNVSLANILGVNINGYLYDNNDVLYQAIGIDDTNFTAITSNGVIFNKASVVFQYLMSFCVESEIITEV